MWDPAYQREHNAVVDGRDDNMNKFKPGVGAMWVVLPTYALGTSLQLL
jgi:hypothetical protein